MSFVPPRCPNRRCRRHREPRPGFFTRHGYYRPRCRNYAIPRFRCRSCRRSFSRQTFRLDWGDRRPETNAQVIGLLIAGVGLRQIGRTVGLDLRSVQGKLRKFGRHCRDLHANLCRVLPEGRTFLLDEEESYEKASIRPLTVPIVIERETWFVVDTAVGPIRRLAPEGTARRRRQAADEFVNGRRRDESRLRVREALGSLRRRVPTGEVHLQTDEKSSYGTIAKSLFGDRLVHETVSSKLVRTTYNPLFPINVTIAMTRDNCGRLRRRSWLVTKKASRLRKQLHVFTVYRNYVRRRFNRDAPEETPAKILGLLPRALRWREVIRWRQDWGQRSIHPTSLSGRIAVGEVLKAV